MQLLDLLIISLRTLSKNKLRSGLTVLGVVIGIAAVITMVSIGQGAGELVRMQFKTLGSNVIVVIPGRGRSGGARQGTVTTLTDADTAAITSECASVLAATPLIGTSGQVIGGNVNWNPEEMFGVGTDYTIVRNWPMASGGFFTERDVASAAKVCVIGHTLAIRLFPDTDPVGQQLRVKNIPFRVVGVLERKGANLFGHDQDDILLMPYTTVRKRLQGSAFRDIGVVLVSARSDKLSQQAEKEIRVLLRERHRIAPGVPADFEVRNTAEIENVLNIITGTLTAMLSAIAAISLVVGGVGIMNIMLVSVTERTREIGLRMAVGAWSRDILNQFLVESVVLCFCGGMAGILVGRSVSKLITAVLGWPTEISLDAVFAAFAVSVTVGIVFGFYPAWKASRLDPINALRYE